MKKPALLVLATLISFSSIAINGILVKTIDGSFEDKWNKTISLETPKLIDCNSVYKDQIFYLAAIAWDFGVNKNNFASVNYSIKILKPDGSIYFEQKDLPFLKGKVENINHLQMSETVLTINFKETDDFGEYKIDLRIFDEVSSKTKDINASIFLKELPSYKLLEIKGEEALNKWFEKYYESPKPETALSYFLFYCKSSLSKDDNSFLPIFSMFLEIVRKNKFIHNQILDSYEEQDERTKIFLIYLIYYSEIGQDDFFSNLQGIEKAAYTEIKNTTFPELYGEIIDASQLDMLWATFFASGSYKPILKLIQTLEYSKYQGSLDKYKTSNKTEEDRQKAIKNSIYNSLVWSFASNCKQHELVKSYSNWALKYEELSDIQRSELKKIMDSL